MFKFSNLVGVVSLTLVLAIIGNAQTASTMNWSPGPSLSAARDSAAAVVNSDGIYVFGGNTAIPTSVEKLPNGSSLWQPAPSLLVGLSSPAAIGSPGTANMTIFGGKDNRRAVNSTFNFNPLGGTANLPSMKNRRYQHAYTRDFSSILYAIGGKDDLEVPTATVERFFGNKWILTTSLPEARFNFPAVTDSFNRITTFGGSTSASGFTSTVLRFDGISWLPLAPMPIATSGSAAVVGANNLIYVIGGTSANGPVDAVQIYHTATDTWTVGTSLPSAVTNASAVLDSTGKIVVIGGRNSANQGLLDVFASPQESAPPVINSFPNTFASIGVNYAYRVTAAGNPAPTFSLVTNPAGMTIDGTTGLISWTPVITQFGVQNVTVRASNASGDVDQSFQMGVPPPAPTGLAASNITANTADLSWNLAPPELGAVSYNLYVRGTICGRGGCPIIPVATGLTSTTVNVIGLGAGTFNTYYLRTVAGGVLSPVSFVSFLTLAVAPPTNVTVGAVGQNSAALSWTAPATSQVPIVGYRIVEFTQLGLRTLVDNTTGTSATVTGLLPNTQHIFYVISFDANNNQSVFVPSTTVNTTFVPLIFHNPAFPKPLGGFFTETLVGVIGDRLMLISPEAHSSAGVNYVVGASGLPAPTLSIASGPAGMTIDPLTGIVSWVPSGDIGVFTATIRATNSEGFADLTFTYTVYPAGTDMLAPTAVQTGFAAVNITRTTATVSWTASTDNVGVAGYRVYITSPIIICGRGGCAPLPVVAPVAVTSGTGTSVTLTGLTRNTGYSFWVEAFDAAGNSSFTTPNAHGNFNTLP